MENRSIPLLLISGFLGAGKTTFLQNLLPLLGKAGFQPNLIINDYGKAEIDAAVLGQLAASVQAINGSCVCCESQNEFLDSLAAAELNDRSVMLVETNGTTDPLEIIEGLALDRRAFRYTAPLHVCVIDAQRWQKRWFHNSLERQQAKTATHHHVSKKDLVDPRRREEIEADLKKLNANAQPGSPDLIVEEVKSITTEAHHHCHSEHCDHHSHSEEDHDHHGHHHDHDHHEHNHDHHASAHGFASVQWPLPAQVSREKLTQWLKNLPREVIRAKGFVRFQDEPDKLYTFQKVEDSQNILYLPLDRQFQTEPLAIFIGVGLAPDQLRFS